MNDEAFRNLNEVRKYLEISKNEFKILLLLALKYKKEHQSSVSVEELYQIIEEAMLNMDYSRENDINNPYITNGIFKNKTVEDSFNRALLNLGYQKIKNY